MPAASARRIAAAVEWLERRPYHVGMAAFAAGIALPEHPRSAVAAAFALACLAPLTRLLESATRSHHRRLGLLAATALLAGVTLGDLRLGAIDEAMRRARPGASLDARATLLGPPRRARFGSSAELRIDSGPAAGARVLGRFRGAAWPAGSRPGSRVHVRGMLVAPRAGRGERFDWGAHLRRREIAAELRLDSVRAIGSTRGGLHGAIDRMRRRGEAALEGGMPREEAAVARGMVLGQDERIDPLLRDDYRRSGLAHLLAVSGQNVMLLCALAALPLGAVGAPRRWRVGVTLVLIALYVPLAGAGPSLQRAGAMGAAALLALGAGRPASRGYALLLAAAVTLAVNPRAAGDPGWQLSFAAVAGMLLLVPALRRPLRWLPGPLAEAIAITAAATVATAPLVAHHFGTVSAVGLLANAAALPLVAPIMWLGMVQVALGVLGAAYLAAPIGHVTALLVGWLDRLARYFADLPGAQLDVVLPTWIAVGAAYSAIAAVAVALRQLARRSEPRAREATAAWRRMPGRRRAAAVAGAGAVAALAWTHVSATPAAPQHVTVSFLDVGQGDATLIQDGAGAAVLFDGGPPEARVYRKLRAAGVRRLDLVVATHQSRDHQGGLREVLERVPTRALLHNGDPPSDPAFAGLLRHARARGVPVVTAHQGAVLRSGRLAIRIVGPPPLTPGAEPAEDPNPRGITAVVSAGDFDLFLSADAESDALLVYPLTPVEAMKVPHHGSADPGLPAVLERLRPVVAAIEVGADNTYGHPTPSTLAALRAAVPHVYRTDRDGTVRLTVDGGEMRVATGK